LRYYAANNHLEGAFVFMDVLAVVSLSSLEPSNLSGSSAHKFPATALTPECVQRCLGAQTPVHGVTVQTWYDHERLSRNFLAEVFASEGLQCLDFAMLFHVG
jgi:hypothetical protein